MVSVESNIILNIHLCLHAGSRNCMSMRQGNSTQRLYSCWQVPAKQHILCVEFWAVVLRFEHGCLFVGYPWCLPTDFCQQFCRRIRFIFNMFTVTVVLISQHLHSSLLADLDDFQCPKNLKKKSLTSHSLRSAFYFLTLFFRLWSSLFFLPLRHSRHQQYYSELYLSRYLSKPEISAKRSKLSFLILPWVHLNNCGKRLKRETFCIGNSTISSAIWKKKTRTSEFFKDLKIARVQRTSVICGVWKTHECVFFSKFHEKSCYYLLTMYTK